MSRAFNVGGHRHPCLYRPNIVTQCLKIFNVVQVSHGVRGVKPRQTPERSEGGKNDCASAPHSLQCRPLAQDSPRGWDRHPSPPCRSPHWGGPSERRRLRGDGRSSQAPTEKRRTPPARPLVEAAAMWNVMLGLGVFSAFTAFAPAVNACRKIILYKNGLYETMLSYRELRHLQARSARAIRRAMAACESTAAPFR